MRRGPASSVIGSLADFQRVYYDCKPPNFMDVMKLARTTTLTHGVIKGVNAKVRVDFPGGAALLVGQLETSDNFGDNGDSGALMVTDDGPTRPVAMVIGGTGTCAALATPIGRILSRFNVRISGDRGR